VRERLETKKQIRESKGLRQAQIGAELEPPGSAGPVFPNQDVFHRGLHLKMRSIIIERVSE
jgi:hypothetical protein